MHVYYSTEFRKIDSRKYSMKWELVEVILQKNNL